MPGFLILQNWYSYEKRINYRVKIPFKRNTLLAEAMYPYYNFLRYKANQENGLDLSCRKVRKHFGELDKIDTLC